MLAFKQHPLRNFHTPVNKFDTSLALALVVFFITLPALADEDLFACVLQKIETPAASLTKLASDIQGAVGPAYRPNQLSFCQPLTGALASLGKIPLATARDEGNAIADKECAAISAMGKLPWPPIYRAIKSYAAYCRLAQSRSREGKALLCEAEKAQAMELALFSARAEAAKNADPEQKGQLQALNVLQAKISSEALLIAGENFRDLHASLAKEFKYDVNQRLAGICKEISNCAQRIKASTRGEQNICTIDVQTIRTIESQGLCSKAQQEIQNTEKQNASWTTYLNEAVAHFETTYKGAEKLSKELRVKSHLAYGRDEKQDDFETRTTAIAQVDQFRKTEAGRAIWIAGAKEIEEQRDAACAQGQTPECKMLTVKFLHLGSNLDNNRLAANAVATKDLPDLEERVDAFQADYLRAHSLEQVRPYLLTESSVDLHELKKMFAEKHSETSKTLAALIKEKSLSFALHDSFADSINHKLFAADSIHTGVGYGLVSGTRAFFAYDGGTEKAAKAALTSYGLGIIMSTSKNSVNKIAGKLGSTALEKAVIAGGAKYVAAPLIVGTVLHGGNVIIKGQEWDWAEMGALSTASLVSGLVGTHLLVAGYAVAEGAVEIGTEKLNIAGIDEFRNGSDRLIQLPFVEKAYAQEGVRRTPTEGTVPAWNKLIQPRKRSPATVNKP